MGLKGHRPYLSPGIQWIAHPQRTGARYECFDERLSDPALNQNPGAGDANLPAVAEYIDQ